MTPPKLPWLSVSVWLPRPTAPLPSSWLIASLAPRLRVPLSVTLALAERPPLLSLKVPPLAMLIVPEASEPGPDRVSVAPLPTLVAPV
ncbi:MAG: hypothetical protein IPQ01_10035 [Zoogloea sp.]|nr:hypothetical protein [Zoogloea sp.]